jgi:hypothetical protein
VLPGILWSVLLEELKRLCSPTSIYVPLGSTILGLIFAFRALETNSISLPGTQEYETSCPETSRRTQSAVWVKLFAATVTTICVQGHAGSLASVHSLSWRCEIYRALEILLSPLTLVVSFLELTWYGFIDLLALTPATWGKNVTLRYRIARLCGCYLDTGASPSLPLQSVNPEHIMHSSLRRDLKWAGRMLILTVVSGQYVQAGFLIARRILTNTAATIDYAMSFLVLSGLIGLFRSFMISLVHCDWQLDPELLPCVEKQCRLPGCTTFKKEQGFPNGVRAVIYGSNVITIPRIALDWLAAGYAQLAIVLHDRRGVPANVFSMFGLFGFWHMWIYALLRWGDTSGSFGDDEKPDEASIPASTPNEEASLPAPFTPEPQEAGRPRLSPGFSWMTIFKIAFYSIRFILDAVTLVGASLQVWYTLGPCIGMYAIIADETTNWRHMNATMPCPQLWKDPLEDELWWF